MGDEILIQKISADKDVQEALKELDLNNDGKIQKAEVDADNDGQIDCNDATTPWMYTTLGPVENSLFKVGLVTKLRQSICDSGGVLKSHFSIWSKSKIKMRLGPSRQKCDKAPSKDPLRVPLKECVAGVEKQWPKLEKAALFSEPRFSGRVAHGLDEIEKGGYGRVDTYGQKGQYCNAYHLHVLMDHKQLKMLCEERGIDYSILDSTKKEMLFRELLQTGDGSYSILYHTEEFTGRFAQYDENRNILDSDNGHITPTESPSCSALTPGDLGSETLMDIRFAIVPKGHPLYDSATELPDERRFVMWNAEKVPE